MLPVSFAQALNVNVLQNLILKIKHLSVHVSFIKMNREFSLSFELYFDLH